MTVSLLKPNDQSQREKWQAFIQSSEQSTLCHDLRWLDVISESFGHKPQYLFSEETTKSGKTEWTGVLPLFEIRSFLFGHSLISMPFLNAGGVLHTDSDSEKELLSTALAMQKDLKTDYLELRYRSQLKPDDNNSPAKNLICRAHKASFSLPLQSDTEQLLASFPAKLRSQIKRPIKAGAKFFCNAGANISIKEIDEFYEIFAEHQRDLGTPVYTRKLFHSVLKHFSCQIVLGRVFLNNKLTSAGFVILHNDQAEILWAASLKAYHRDSVNMLLYWGLIEYLAKAGVKSFDFGRSSYGSGGYKFKKQWNGIEQSLYWYYQGKDNYIPDVNPHSSKFSLATSAWKMMPLGLSKKVGPVISRQIP